MYQIKEYADLKKAYDDCKLRPIVVPRYEPPHCYDVVFYVGLTRDIIEAPLDDDISYHHSYCIIDADAIKRPNTEVNEPFIDKRASPYPPVLVFLAGDKNYHYALYVLSIIGFEFSYMFNNYGFSRELIKHPIPCVTGHLEELKKYEQNLNLEQYKI
jgi:hypothetical protein